MSHSYFAVLDEAQDESGVFGRFAAGEHTVGPWSPGLQHGGPPSALAVALAERTVRLVTQRPDMAPRRVAVDFVGAVPVAELEVRTRVVRAARSAELVEASLTASGRECLTARVWFVREARTEHVENLPDTPARIPDDPGVSATGLGLDFGYGNSVQWRYLCGAIREAGPAAVWARPTLPLVEGWEYSGLSRAVLVADSASGVSAELDWSTWSFVNVDLDVHLARPVVGEWILLDASTQLGPAGSALARSTISDERGVVGAGLQTLVLTPVSGR